jgi:hypothetical protein
MQYVTGKNIQELYYIIFKKLKLLKIGKFRGNYRGGYDGIVWLEFILLFLVC